MATLSVLNYNISNGLNMKLNQQNVNLTSVTAGNSLNKTFNKITVQNVLSENSRNSLNISNGNPNAIVRKIKDFGMIGAVNNASGAASLNINPRKRPLVESKPNLKRSENKLTPSANKKPKLTKEERAAIRAAKKSVKENTGSINMQPKQPLTLLQHTKIPGTPGRKGLPLPQAVARRNARERNRVKQVNNGFAALRERIPEEVAEVFENQGPKGSGKKLSKVETLRMAVEYIRSLEKLLGFDFPIGSGGHHHTSSSGEESFSLIKDEFDAYSPSMDEQFDDSLSHYDTEEFFNGNTNNQSMQIPPSSPPSIQQMDMLPNITTLNGLQYIRIPGTNTYQLLTPDIFVGTAASPPSSTIDEEHFNALIDTNCVSPTSSMSLSPIQQQQQQQQQANANTAAVEQRCTPPSSINSSELIRRVQETAPVLAQHITNGENMNEGSTTLLSSSISSSSPSPSSLLLSPVPQNQQQHQHHHQILTITSPSSASNKSPVLHQQQQQQQQHRTLSPASANDHHLHQEQQQQQHHHQQAGLRQTCAANQQLPEFLLPHSSGQQIGTTHMIKQEFEEPSITYQQQTSPLPIQLQQQQQQQHQHQQPQQQPLYHPVTSLAMSPPLDRNTPTATVSTSSMSSTSQSVLQHFYTHEQHSSFYEGVVTLKKEFNEVLLDASNSTNVLSDESMIEAIDWWDAHTPKSDGGSAIL